MWLFLHQPYSIQSSRINTSNSDRSCAPKKAVERPSAFETLHNVDCICKRQNKVWRVSRLVLLGRVPLQLTVSCKALLKWAVWLLAVDLAR